MGKKEWGDSLEIFYSKVAAKALGNLETSIKLRIKVGIEGLLEVPPKGDIKQMQGVVPPAFRLRIGKYRVIYEYRTIDDEKVLFIKDIGTRGDIYK